MRDLAIRACFAVSLAGLVVAAVPARADAVEDFYRGTTITVICYSDAGSAYDVYARLLAKYMPAHLPGHPTMIVKSMVGAGGLTATRYLYSSAPHDGSVIGTIGRGIAFEPLLGEKTVDFDALKFLWIGSMEKETTFYVSWQSSQVKQAQDLFTHDLLLAGTGAGADSELISRALDGILGTRIKLITGYSGVAAAALAMERGEIEGLYWTLGGVMTSHPDWLAEKKINLLFQTRRTPHPLIPDVPLVASLAKTEAQHQALDLLFARDLLGRPFLAPPDIPRDRAAALRRAFEATMSDKQLLADAEKGKMEIELVTGSELEEVIRTAYATPKPVVDMVQKAMGR